MRVVGRPSGLGELALGWLLHLCVPQASLSMMSREGGKASSLATESDCVVVL